MAVGKKMAVARMDLGLRRPIPQSICPDVQPLLCYAQLASKMDMALKSIRGLTLVPHPARIPLPQMDETVLRLHSTVGYLGTSLGNHLIVTRADSVTPMKNQVARLRPWNSFRASSNSRRKIPETPRIAPVSKRRTVAARCRRIAPAAVSIGVNMSENQ
jgi:hypothetical protein